MFYILATILITVLLALIGLINYRLLRSGKRLRTALLFPVTLSFLFSALILFSFLLDQSTFQRLTKEHTVASIKFERTGSQEYTAILTPAFSDPISISLSGDQWQLDARIMKWKGLANYLGFKPLYSFERLSGRYQSVKEELNKPRTVVQLDPDTSFNYWNILVENQQDIPWLDAYYGNAVYLPMTDKANYMITLGQQGLIARPRNLHASQALQQWQVPESIGNNNF